MIQQRSTPETANGTVCTICVQSTYSSFCYTVHIPCRMTPEMREDIVAGMLNNTYVYESPHDMSAESREEFCKYFGEGKELFEWLDELLVGNVPPEDWKPVMGECWYPTGENDNTDVIMGEWMMQYHAIILRRVIADILGSDDVRIMSCELNPIIYNIDN